MKSLFVGLVVLILVAIGILYLVDTDSPRSPNTSTPTSTIPGPPVDETINQPPEANIPNDFRLHAEPQNRYSVALPYEVDVSSPQAGITRYRYVGPNNQPASEITDGYTITVEARPTSTNSLESLVDQEIETNATQVLSEPEAIVVAGNEALRYTTEAALGNQSITHYALLPGNGFAYLVSINVSSTGNDTYRAATAEILSTLHFLNVTEATSMQAQIVPIAMLDYEAVGNQYVRESSGKERGCDTVVLIEHVLSESTTTPLTASLTQLFAYERETVGGWQNFIASQNDSLAFDRVEIVNGVAKVYLSGELGPMGGVCDNPRAAIQIEETALAYETVDAVELYLNEEHTDLIPSGRGQ